jgi:ADP-ribosylglycohydrolase
MDQYSLSQRFQGALLGSTIGQQSTTQPIDFQPCLNWLCHQQPPPSLGDDPIANAIDLLPLWLYTHESWRERQNRLEQLPLSQFSTLNSSPLWLYGEAIAQLLRPNCNPTNLLPSIQTRWQQHAQRGAPELTPPWHDCLTQIHQWQQQHAPLHQVQTELAQRPASERAIATALYCFVRSPNDWPIALRLISQITDSEPAIGGLLGGLWGAYNGWTRFPIDAIAPSIDPANPIPFTTTTQKLLQIWSGRIPIAPISDPRTPAIVMGPR